MNLLAYFPTPADLEAAPVDAVAGALLKVLAKRQGRGWIAAHPKNVLLAFKEHYVRFESVEAISEAMTWLSNRGYLCQSPDSDLGWFVVSRQGLLAAEVENFSEWAAERDIPDSLVHPSIREGCLSLFRQGRFDTAVFEAFKALEVRIRDRAGLGNELVGVKLAARAFNPENGELTDLAAEGGERQALMSLMTGAIGSYKNPQSHRHVDVSGSEAREMILIASHLLRIVESRTKNVRP